MSGLCDCVLGLCTGGSCGYFAWLISVLVRVGGFVFGLFLAASVLGGFAVCWVGWYFAFGGRVVVLRGVGFVGVLRFYYWLCDCVVISRFLQFAVTFDLVCWCGAVWRGCGFELGGCWVGFTEVVCWFGFATVVCGATGQVLCLASDVLGIRLVFLVVWCFWVVCYGCVMVCRAGDVVGGVGLPSFCVRFWFGVLSGW